MFHFSGSRSPRLLTNFPNDQPQVYNFFSTLRQCSQREACVQMPAAQAGQSHHTPAPWHSMFIYAMIKIHRLLPVAGRDRRSP